MHLVGFIMRSILLNFVAQTISGREETVSTPTAQFHSYCYHFLQLIPKIIFSNYNVRLIQRSM